MIYMERLNIFHQDLVFMYYFICGLYGLLFKKKTRNSTELSANLISINHNKPNYFHICVVHNLLISN